MEHSERDCVLSIRYQTIKKVGNGKGERRFLQKSCRAGGWKPGIIKSKTQERVWAGGGGNSGKVSDDKSTVGRWYTGRNQLGIDGPDHDLRREHQRYSPKWGGDLRLPRTVAQCSSSTGEKGHSTGCRPWPCRNL